MSTAGIVIIGDEILSGKFVEENAAFLIGELRALGVDLRRITVIPDDIEDIGATVLDASRRFDYAFTSGGVGPTHDDVTIEGVARAFGVVARTDETMAALLRATYGDRCTDGHLRMALVPEGSELASTPEVQWPTPVMRNVWILPGVPEIFRMKLAVVRECVRGPEPFVSHALFTQLDEAELKPLLDRVVAEHPDVEVGSYPKWFDPAYKTKITFDGRSAAAVQAATESLIGLLPPGEPCRIE